MKMKIFVEAKGVEPLLEEPKSSVLPLDDASMNKSIQATINYQANVKAKRSIYIEISHLYVYLLNTLIYFFYPTYS